MTSGDDLDRAMWRRIARLPLRVRVAGVVLLLAASAPAAAAVVVAVGGASAASPLRAHAVSLNVITVCFAFAALIAFERPRSASPLAYARQLRARLAELQSTFDADDRRRPGEGKEKEDARVPSEP